jgi:2-deoxy-D-gluconate 3-dehydrogenase
VARSADPPDSPFAADALAGLTALVTGATRGIGRGVAAYLARLGARVLVTGRSQEAASHAAAELGGAEGIALDVADPDSIGAAVETAWAGGGIDVLVNNAGTNIPQKALEVTRAAWDEVVTTNLTGLFFMSQAVARRWVAEGRAGNIVNIGSQSGLVALDLRAAYCASKAGVVNLTRELAFEWAEHGIRVNCVAPTFVLTPMTRPMLDDPGFARGVLDMIPLGRLAEPDEVAAAVAYLATPAAAMITGHTLVVDGGWTIH